MGRKLRKRRRIVDSPKGEPDQYNADGSWLQHNKTNSQLCDFNVGPPSVMLVRWSTGPWAMLQMQTYGCKVQQTAFPIFLRLFNAGNRRLGIFPLTPSVMGEIFLGQQPMHFPTAETPHLACKL